VPERPEQLEPLAALLTTQGYQVRRDGRHVLVDGITGPAAEINRRAMAAGIALDGITPVSSNLEETFMAMTREGER